MTFEEIPSIAKMKEQIEELKKQLDCPLIQVLLNLDKDALEASLLAQEKDLDEIFIAFKRGKTEY